ncbi:hypothetical protein ACLOJK_024248, partial [Asimina triloba]
MGSGGKISVTARRAGTTLSVLGSFSHISLPLSTVSDLLFSGGGVDNINVDNGNRPLSLPGADSPILSGSFFALASPGHAERSPSAAREILTICFPTSSASKGADAASGGAAEPVAPVGGGAVEDGNSSVGQHVATGGDYRVVVGEEPPQREGSGGSSSGPAPLLDINVEFVEPFRKLVSSCSVQLQRPLYSLLQKHLTRVFSSFRDEFIASMDALSDLDDLDHLLGLCNSHEHSLKNFGATLTGLLALIQLLTRLHDDGHPLSKQITLPFGPEFIHDVDIRLNLEQEVKQLTTSVDRCRVAFPAKGYGGVRGGFAYAFHAPSGSG